MADGLFGVTTKVVKEVLVKRAEQTIIGDYGVVEDAVYPLLCAS